jgi:hypothetical protein
MGSENDLFAEYDMHPNDMEFELVELSQSIWDSHLNKISSHSNMTNIPGRCYRLAILEKNTNKWVGFIRLGSPVINMKPRNELLGGAFTKTKLTAYSFNKTTIMGFVIVPVQPFGYNYLGGKLLAGICCSHNIREELNKRYDMNTCMFETTSLYGSSKSTSQYDGMKPLIRFKGITESNFVPMIHGNAYDKLKKYVEDSVGVFVTEGVSSRKLKIITKVISMTKSALKGTPEGHKFEEVLAKALLLTEKKRYYVSNYGISNYIDIINGKTDKIIPDKENYDKHELENIIRWWKKKASNRYETLKAEKRIRTKLEIWTDDSPIEIIR